MVLPLLHITLNGSVRLSSTVGCCLLQLILMGNVNVFGTGITPDALPDTIELWLRRVVEEEGKAEKEKFMLSRQWLLAFFFSNF